MDTPFTEKTCEAFVAVLSSAAPVPGGGGAARPGGGRGHGVGRHGGKPDGGAEKIRRSGGRYPGRRETGRSAAKTPPGTGRGGCGGIHAALSGVRDPQRRPQPRTGPGRRHGGRLPGPAEMMALCCASIELLEELLEKGAPAWSPTWAAEHCAVRRPWRAPASISSSTPGPCRTAPMAAHLDAQADTLLCEYLPPGPGGWPDEVGHRLRKEG